MMPRHRDTAHDRHETVVAERAERVLSDERYPALRTRRSRLLLVAAMTAAIVAVPVAWLAGGALWGPAAVIAGFGVLFVLRYSIRVIADLPEHVLDERLRRSRDSAYVEAYRWFAGLSVILASVAMFAFVVNADESDVWALELSWDAVMSAFWVLMLAALAMPSMVVALTSGDEPPIDPTD
jgi:uncharacterized membrane protein